MSKTFKDFSGGWAGSLDLAKVQDNMFDARNMLLYRDGSIGPRPGLKEYDLGRTLTGTVYGADTRRDVSAPETTVLLYQDATKLWRVNDDNTGDGVQEFALALAVPPTGFPTVMYHKTNFRTFIHIPNTTPATGGTYKFQGGTITRLTNSSFGGTPYGVRVLRSEHQGLRLYYSAANDDTDWPALNFIDIGNDPGAGIIHIAEQNNHAVIVTDYGAWYMLTGVPGVNDVVRLIYQDLVFPSPIGIGAFVSTNKNELWCLSPSNNFPLRFDGSKLEPLSYLSMTPEDPYASYAADMDVAHVKCKALLGADGDSPAFILTDPTNRLLLRQNGAWGLHDFTGVTVGHAWATSGRGRLFGFTTANAPLTLDLNLNRPAFTSDTHARPGDLSDTPLVAYLTLPEQWSEDGDHLLVKEVIIDFKRYATGSATTNQIVATVESLARGSEIALASATQTWSQAGASSTTTGVEDRVRFNFGDQGQGAGWRLKLTGIRGVSIRQVIVNDEAQQSNSRAF